MNRANPFAIPDNIIHPLPGLDMSLPQEHAAKAHALGIKGPWMINPGNPSFPNHRPYLSNPKPPNEQAAVPPQILKTT